MDGLVRLFLCIERWIIIISAGCLVGASGINPVGCMMCIDFGITYTDL